MPRKTNLALAVCVAVALTLGVGAAYVAVDARPASPVLSATAASSATAQDTCAPKYRVRKTRLGLNRFGSQGFGRVPVVRNWDTHGELRSSWSEQTRDVPRRTAMVISFRYSPQQVIAGQWDAQINGFFKNAPQRRLIFWNFYHEPETPVKAHEFTPTQFRKAFRHIDRISARYCRPNLLPTLVLQGWTADPHSGASVNGLLELLEGLLPRPALRLRRCLGPVQQCHPRAELVRRTPLPLQQDRPGLPLGPQALGHGRDRERPGPG